MNRPEIVIGLVYAAGTAVDTATQALSRALTEVGYREEAIRLSKLLEVTPLPPELALVETPFDQYLRSRMKAGTYWRETMKRGDAMVLLGISSIRDARKKYHGGSENAETQPIPNRAFIIR